MILLFVIFGITCNILDFARHKKHQLVFNLLVSLGMGWFCWYTLGQQADFVDEALRSFQSFLGFGWPILLGLGLLMGLNWWLESKKWQLLVNRLEVISIWTALESVMLGLVFGVFVPRSVGYPFGRIYRLPVAQKWKLVGASLLNSTLQLVVTLIFGILGLAVVFWSELPMDAMYRWSSWASIGLAGLLLVLIALRRSLVHMVLKLSPKLAAFIVLIHQYTPKDIIHQMVLSMVRYVVFAAQLLLVLYCFHPGMDWWLMFGLVSVVYLFKTIIPSPNLVVDLGVRQLSGMALLELGGVSPADAFTATLVIWMVNLLLPSVLGVVLLWRRR